MESAWYISEVFVGEKDGCLLFENKQEEWPMAYECLSAQVRGYLIVRGTGRFVDSHPGQDVAGILGCGFPTVGSYSKEWAPKSGKLFLILIYEPPYHIL